MRGTFGQSLVRTSRYILLVLLGFTISMGVAFGVVRYLTRDLSMVPGLDPMQVDQAAQLRHASNTLLQLFGAYLDEIALDAQALKPGARQWIARGFSPKLNELRNVLDNDALMELPPCRRLAAAAERAANMAAHPEDQALRRRTAEDILKAAQETEAYLVANNLTPYLTEAPQKAPFRL